MGQDQLLPILELEELVEIFGYKNVRAARRALRLGKFPVKTFELAGRTVAHVDVVEQYVEHMRTESISHLERGGRQRPEAESS